MKGGRCLKPQPRAAPDCECRTTSACSCVLLASSRRRGGLVEAAPACSARSCVLGPTGPATRGRSVDRRQMSQVLATLEAEWELGESWWCSQRPSLALRGHLPLPGTHRGTWSCNLLGQSRHTSEAGAVILPVLLSPREGVVSENTQAGRGRARIRTQAGWIPGHVPATYLWEEVVTRRIPSTRLRRRVSYRVCCSVLRRWMLGE